MFNPTQEMIDDAGNVFKSMAYLQTIEPVVIAYKTKVLAENEFYVSKQNEARIREFKSDEPYRILEPSRAYLMSDEDFLKYLELINKERDAAQLIVEDDGHCPLLVAEDLLTRAKRKLIATFQPITKIDPDKIYDPEKRDQLVELTLRLMAPFMDSKIILQHG